jgi:peptidoglycan hydrolase-like protein with peptidoglycan-binding domain
VALQRALTSLGYFVTVDGVFGEQLERAVKTYQSRHGLAADGVAGLRTQARMLQQVDVRVDRHVLGVPDGLMRGFMEFEGGNVLAAVNWSVAGGVDCGCMQLRVTGPPYSHQRLVTAFHPLGAAVEAAQVLMERKAVFARRSGTARSPFTSLGLAVLAHNWPWAADQYSRYGAISNPNGAAPWVPSSLPASARTREGWCKYYVAKMTTYL